MPNNEHTKALDRLKSMAQNSAIIRLFIRISDFFSKNLGTSFASALFSSYDTVQDKFKSSLIHRLITFISDKNRLRFKLAVASRCENSVLLSWIANLFKRILASPVRVAGCALFSFGFYSMLVYLLQLYVFMRADLWIIDLVVSVACMVAAVLLLSSSSPITKALRYSYIISALMFRILGVRSEQLETHGAKPLGYIPAFAVSMAAGLLTFFVPPMHMAVGLLGLVFFIHLLKFPELGVYIILAGLPFLPTMVMAGLVIITALCFFLKLIRGKRSLCFEVFDLAILLFGLVVLSSGVVSVSSESLKPSLLMLCFICGYFILVNLIRSSDIIRRSVISVVLSSFAVAVYGLYQKLAGLDQTTWTDTEMFEEMAGRIVSTLENPNVLGEYLILTIPLSLVCLLKAKGIWKPVMLAINAAQLFCLVFTMSRGAWLGFIICMAILIYIYNSRVLAVYAAGLLCIPLLPAVLPESIIKRFTSIGDLADSSTSYRVSIWQAALDMLGDLWRSGIGMGSQAFGAVYPQYTLAGIESAPHSHNLFLQIAIESGLIGLIIFLVLVVLLLQIGFSYISRASDKWLRIGAGACLCSIIGVLIQGMTDYIWYNYRVLFMFWIITAMCVAICRCPDSAQDSQDVYPQD